MIHTIVAAPIAFVANAIVSRSLGVADYGRLALITLVITIATSVTDLGVSDGVIQWGAAAHARGDRTVVNSLLMRSLGYRLAFQLPIMAVTVAVIGRGEPPLVLLALLVCVAAPALLGSVALAIGIQNRTAAAAQIAMVGNVVVQAAVATTAALSRSPVAVWTSRALTMAAFMPLNMLPIDRPTRRAALRPRLPVNMPHGFWKFSVLTAASGLVALMVFSRSELLVLRGVGTIEAAGLFALAFGLSQQITAPIDAVLGPLNPAVAGIVEAHPARVRQALLRATRVSGLLAAALCVIGLPVLYALIPLIYGKPWAPAAPAFLLLAITSCLQSVVNPLLTFNRARRRSALLLRINCAALVVDVALAFAAIPFIGLWGAVAANAAGQLTLLILLARSECRAWSIRATEYVRALAAFLSAAVGTGLTVLVFSASEWYPPLATTAAVAASGLVVLVGTRLSGGRVPVDDVRPALDVLPRRIARVVALLLRPVTA